MKDIDSLIYIVIAIVAFAISLLGKKKKNDALKARPLSDEDATQSEERPFLSTLERLLNEEMGITTPEFQSGYVEKPVFEKEPELVKEEKILDVVPAQSFDDKEEFSYSIEFDDTNEIFSKSIKDADLTQEEVEPIIKDFNMRDAIIYSEILTRKEY